MDQACGRCSRIGSGAPPVPGRLTNTIRFPSGDQRGLESREGDGARYRICVVSFVETPMKEWSPRLDTNASREPSGDHSAPPLSPRAKKKRLPAAEPSIGADQSPRSLTNTTRSLFGEIRGSSPS